ncbi:methylenetetrahydrofolate reductase (NADPH),mmuM, BHMT2; homocysteine S-methyltransferase [Anaerolineae bacterium]|nr:methylenetetrahydrofolate reductase (NADPH),mmuM, BHMT2; homocysteine S-methyltransferase [Anaerolineae bacterium]
MRPTIQELLAQRKPILYDGATITYLQSMGLPLNTPAETWVLDNAVNVYAAAQAYVNAGSQIILTCTFGGTAFALRAAGLEARADEVNRRAAELARQAAQDRALVAGSIGPLGNFALAMGSLTYIQAVNDYSDQARSLVEGGVDLIQIETMGDLQETRAAVEGVRRVTDLPIFATMSFDTEGRTALGVPPDIAAQFLLDLHVDAIGANCGRGPEVLASILREMRHADTKIPLIAKPNTGNPEMRTGGVSHPIDPGRFAIHAREWIRATAKIIGGCCGTTPEHIAAVKAVMGGQ